MRDRSPPSPPIRLLLVKLGVAQGKPFNSEQGRTAQGKPSTRDNKVNKVKNRVEWTLSEERSEESKCYYNNSVVCLYPSL